MPQADPNTASQTQRLMKVLALKQLVATNPTLYDPIAVDTAALQALGWSNPQQFMVPATAQQKPPPELLKMMADAQNEKTIADARMLDSQTRAQESAIKMQLEQAKLAMEHGQNGVMDPIKAADMQLRQQELVQKGQDAVIDAINRKRDRESRERLAAVKLAEELIRNPQGLGVVQQVIDPNMLNRLERTEAPLDPNQTGEL